MATEERRASALINRVLNGSEQFDFFQAVRLLKLTTALSPNNDTSTSSRGVNRNHAIEFKSDKSLCFTGHAISSVEWNQSQQSFEVTSNPLALIGAAGVLPDYFTQEVVARSRNNDNALKSLLDLFHQRIQELLFVTLGKYQIAYGFETQALDANNERDLFSHCLQQLLGLAHTPHKWRNLELENLIFRAGLFLHGNRPATGLEALIEEYFTASVTVRQFQGQWLQLSSTDQSRLSVRPERSRFARLGVDFTLGTSVWDLRSCCRVVLGPLTRRQFQELMPGQPGNLRLAELTRLYAGTELEFLLQPEISQTETAPWQLDGNDTWGRLGWSTWLNAEPENQEQAPPPIIPLN